MSAPGSGGFGPAGFIGGPLRGARVLVPRSGEWGDEAADLVRAFGGAPIIAPLIEFAAPEDAGPLETACRALAAGEYDWLVVTSPRTVDALAECGALARLAGPDPSTGSGASGGSGASDGAGASAGIRVAAVGASTAAALAEHGVATDWLPESEASARAMVREWPDMPRARILWPRSSEARRTIAEGLAERGHLVDDPIAYRTAPAQLATEPAARLRDGGVDWVLVTAGSVARSLAEQVGTRIPARIATIGPIATADARAAGFDVAIEAAAPSVLAMLEAMVAGREPESGPIDPDDPFAGLFAMPDLP